MILAAREDPNTILEKLWKERAASLPLQPRPPPTNMD